MKIFVPMRLSRTNCFWRFVNWNQPAGRMVEESGPGITLTEMNVDGAGVAYDDRSDLD